MGAIEEGAKVGSAVVDAMRSTPLAIALLVVNVAFIGFVGYILSEVASNARERNESQTKLIEKLATECRGPARTMNFRPKLP